MVWKSLFKDGENRGRIKFPELSGIPVDTRKDLIRNSGRITMRSPSYWCVTLPLAILMIVLSAWAFITVSSNALESLIALIAFTIVSVTAIIIPLKLDLRIRKKWIQKRLNELGIRPICCLHCQYNLRGTPDESTSCPECGAAIAAATHGTHDELVAEGLTDPPAEPGAKDEVK